MNTTMLSEKTTSKKFWRWRLVITCFVFCWATSMSAQSVWGQSVRRLASISGVISAIDGPVIGALIKAWRKSEQEWISVGTTFSGQNGQWSKSIPQAGLYKIEISKTGYLVDVDHGLSHSYVKEISVGDGQSVSGLRFQMVKGGVIAGKVTDVVDKAVPTIEVTANMAQDSDLMRTQTETRVTFTDDRGDYRFFNLLPGRYIVSVGLKRSVLTDYEFPFVYYKGSHKREDANVIDVKTETIVSNVDMKIDLGQKPLSLTGEVRASDAGEVLPGIHVTLEQPANGVKYTQITDLLGRFIFNGLNSGKYTLNTESPYKKLKRDTRDIEIEEAQSKDIVISLNRDAGIYFTVEVKDSEVNLSQIIFSLKDEIGSEMRFISDDSSRDSWFLPAPRKGLFWWSLLGMPGNCYVSQILVEGEDHTLMQVNIAENSFPKQIHMVIESRGSAVRGVLKAGEGKDYRESIVCALPVDDHRYRSRLFHRCVSLDPKMAFTISALAPGEYYLSIIGTHEKNRPDFTLLNKERLKLIEVFRTDSMPVSIMKKESTLNLGAVTGKPILLKVE